jgi:hypothetical protein
MYIYIYIHTHIFMYILIYIHSAMGSPSVDPTKIFENKIMFTLNMCRLFLIIIH